MRFKQLFQTSFLLSSLIVLFAAPDAVAQEPVASDLSESTASRSTERWSSSVQLHVAPFENYPNWGGSIDTHLRWRRFRFGMEMVVFAPRQYGNVSRFVALVQPSAQFFLIDTSVVDWTAGAAMGLGLFHDNYVEIYDDITRFAPGFSLNTEVEWQASSRFHPTAGFRAMSYFAGDVADDKWLEFTLGLRILWGR